MPIQFGNNIISLQAQGNVERTSRELSKTFERLSSGLRINSAADDPAGLAIADSLRSDAKLASVAVRNANDGLSVTAVADGALEEVENILTRMAELANQSANGTYTTSQRSALSTEFLALGSEIDRIARTAQFNDINLLSNSSAVTLQVGIRSGSDNQISINAVLGTLESLGLASSGSSALSFSIISTSVAGSQNASLNALSAVQAAMTSVTTRRGVLGAAESRLTSAINFLSLARENFIAAESRIRDVDVAEEVANLVRLQVIQQAGVAMLAQANQQPALALQSLS